MKAVNNITKSDIVFSRFSGKGYAVFASLGKIVKIGRITKDMSNLAMQKSDVCNATSNIIVDSGDGESNSFTQELIALLSLPFITASLFIEQFLFNVISSDVSCSSASDKNIIYLKYLSLPLITCYRWQAFFVQKIVA